jgi:hypothetical protein
MYVETYSMRLERLFVICLLVLMLAACRESQQPTATFPADTELTNPITLSLLNMPDPITVGETMLQVRLTDADGEPLREASIEVRGDMTHAGMMPVMGTGTDDDRDGVYDVPFDWNMGGDWVLTITATTPDGTVVSQMFAFNVDA